MGNLRRASRGPLARSAVVDTPPLSPVGAWWGARVDKWVLGRYGGDWGGLCDRVDLLRTASDRLHSFGGFVATHLHFPGSNSVPNPNPPLDQTPITPPGEKDGPRVWEGTLLLNEYLLIRRRKVEDL